MRSAYCQRLRGARTKPGHDARHDTQDFKALHLLDRLCSLVQMLVNGANQGATRLDPRAALDMQKLLLSIAQSDPAVVKQHQRHVEDCLTNLMLSGAPPPVPSLPFFTECVSFARCIH